MYGIRSLRERPEESANPLAPRPDTKAGDRRQRVPHPGVGLLPEPPRRRAERPAPLRAATQGQEAAAAEGGCVAVIDPDATYRKAMATCLRAKGFQVLELSAAGASCIPALAEARADAALIDAAILRRAGDGFLQDLRARLPRLQVAVVSSDDDEQAEETLLAAGVADFFTRGRSAAIVTKRLKLLVDGARGVETGGDEEDRNPAEEEVEIGPLTLRLGSHRALWAEQELPLTVTEFRIVRLLATTDEFGASYRSIYDVVHGEGFSAGDGPDGFRTNVRSLVRRIRRKFRAVEPDFDEIENLPGHGYRWRGPQKDGDVVQPVAEGERPRRAPSYTPEEWRIEP